VLSLEASHDTHIARLPVDGVHLAAPQVIQHHLATGMDATQLHGGIVLPLVGDHGVWEEVDGREQGIAADPIDESSRHQHRAFRPGQQLDKGMIDGAQDIEAPVEGHSELAIDAGLPGQD